MPNTLMSLDEYAIVQWDKYIVITFFSNLQPHHLSLLDEFLKKKECFKSNPTILDFIRVPELNLREKSFLLDLKGKLPQYVIVSNEALNAAFQKSGFYNQVPITKDFKSALQKFGISYQPKVDVNLVNAFVQCAVKVFCAQTGETVSIGRPTAQKKPAASDFIGIIPTNSSHFSGMFLLSLPNETLKQLFAKAFKYEPENFQCELEGFLSDILELIHESARTELKDKGFIFYPSSATVLKQGHLDQYLSDRQLFLNIPLEFTKQPFQACVGVEGIA